MSDPAEWHRRRLQLPGQPGAPEPQVEEYEPVHEIGQERADREEGRTQAPTLDGERRGPDEREDGGSLPGENRHGEERRRQRDPAWSVTVEREHGDRRERIGERLGEV